jgi:hypothetical protein
MRANHQGDGQSPERQRKSVRSIRKAPQDPFLDDEAEDRFRRRVAGKLNNRSASYGAFEAVLAYLLRQRWQGVYILRLSLTIEHQLVGCPQIEGADIADMGPKPLLGLCSLEKAIRKICELAEKAKLTSAERAYLLNRLPSAG